MSPRGAQQRTLDVMEAALETSAPRLTAMFAMFTRLAADEGPVRAERLSERRYWLHESLLLLLPVAAVVMLIVSLVLGLSANGASACTPTNHTHTTSCWTPPRK